MYYLETALDEVDSNILTVGRTVQNLDAALDEIRRAGVAENVERNRVLREILQRPNQQKFRREVLEAYGTKCLITGTSIEAVLEAAHIVPATKSNDDTIGNGICLRSDIHRLYDTRHLRINASGSLHLSEMVVGQDSYETLPRQIQLPSFINMANVEWRWRYY
jgi:predicted restriction endonuclease